LSTKIATVILGGGRGSRLHPLTVHRAKPAVPVGGKYRLIDITISNALNSGYRHIFVLTQFNSASLNDHLSLSYRFDMFTPGSVQVLAAEQTADAQGWYQGTADAVRRQLHQFQRPGLEHVLILSGDHLYRMDYRKLVAHHESTGADVTVAAIPVGREDCDEFGILCPDDSGRVHSFREKPGPDEDLTSMQVPDALRMRTGMGDRAHLASMGVYVFRKEALWERLASSEALDFGSEILPSMLDTGHVGSFIFDGYWQDIGTIGAFYEANLALCQPEAPFRFWHEKAPIFTRQRFLPASRFERTRLEHSMVSDGCLVVGASLERCIIGLRTRIGEGVNLKDAIIMGADFFEHARQRAANRAAGTEDVGIGPGTTIERAIIDKNARIGANVVIRGAADRPDADGPGWAIRDGIVIVEKNAVLPAGTVI
jgi:glucose-1-phosphate adenylyltransferase